MDTPIQARTRHYRSRNDHYNIYFLGDLHVGAAACHEKRLKEDIDKIKEDDRAIVFGMGDYMDCVAASDKRFDQISLAPWIKTSDIDKIFEKQIHKCADYLEPIADKIDVLVAGNHEEKVRKLYYCDPVSALSRELKTRTGISIKSCGKTICVRLSFNRLKNNGHIYDAFLHHGWFAGRMPGSKANNIKRLANDWSTDIIAVAHGHERVGVPIRTMCVVREDNKLAVKERIRAGLMTGSYLRTYGENSRGYGEDMGYSPATIGCACIRLYPQSGEMEIVT